MICGSKYVVTDNFISGQWIYIVLFLLIKLHDWTCFCSRFKSDDTGYSTLPSISGGFDWFVRIDCTFAWSSHIWCRNQFQHWLIALRNSQREDPPDHSGASVCGHAVTFQGGWYAAVFVEGHKKIWSFRILKVAPVQEWASESIKRHWKSSNYYFIFYWSLRFQLTKN